MNPFYHYQYGHPGPYSTEYHPHPYYLQKQIREFGAKPDIMNPYYHYQYQYWHTDTYSTEYHAPYPYHSHPYYCEQYTRDPRPRFPTVSRNTAVDSTSRDGVVPRRTVFPKSQSVLRKEEKDGQFYKRLAALAESRRQQCVGPPSPTTTSKVMKQTSVDSNIANLSGEHSQSSGTIKMEQGPRNQGNVQQPQMACTSPKLQNESTSSVCMAIRKKGFLGKEVTAEDGVKIQMDIHKMIETYSCHGISPQFEDCSIEDGTLIVRCANEVTVRWFTMVFDHNEDVFNGLRLIQMSNLPKIKVAFTSRNVLTSDPVVFLKRLQHQNPNLRTQYWTLVESPTMETQQLSQRWICKIDQGSADAIKAANMTAYTGLFKGTFEFLPDVESPTEIVIKQEEGAPLLICID